ncbi:MAG: glycerophosphodiester phosphodiesterase [Gemmatimonas sp.]|nr:glycerophosphodiester phosphodiesterase [Gemmatimonas sp.]
MRGRRLLLPALALVATGALIVQSRRRELRPGAAFFAGSPLLIAHRGGAALAPENTLLAFQRALEWWGADVLELDVQPSRDGDAVVIHDPTLDRTTNGSGLVADHSLAEIRELDAAFHFTPDGGETFPFRGRGFGVPSLADVLSDFPDARVNIEIKDGRVQEAVWEAIREADALERVLIAAGSTRDRARLKDYPVPFSAGKQDLLPFIAQLRLGFILYVPPVDAFQIPDRWEGREVATPALIRAARHRNIPVHVWTVDDLEAMTRYLDWGVDGIVTDRPDRLARLLHERTGRPLPPGPPSPLPEAFLERLLLT